MTIRWIFLLAISASIFSGCASLDVQPRQGDTVNGTTNPATVPIRLTWPNGDLLQGPQVEVDGTAVSPLTVTVTGATGSIDLSAGSHNIRARTTQKCWYCSGGTTNFDLTKQFEVTVPGPPAPSISLFPSTSSKTIQRGQSDAFNVGVGWNNFSDPLDYVFDSTSIPTGVTVSPSSGTVTTANPSINANISVQNNAIASTSNNIKLTVKKTGGTPNATNLLALTVAPKAGNFVFRQAPSVPPPATPIMSPDGNFKAVITRQGTTRFYDAEFSTASGQVIATIPFEVQGGQLGGSGASNIAGVLFCQASPTTTAAIIGYDNLSSQPPPMHKLTTLVLTDPRKSHQALISGFSYRFGYIPQVGFSPDCSVIAAVGTTPNPAINSISASGGVAAFVEAQTNSSVTFSFSDPTTPVSASITAGRTVTFSTPAGGSQSQTLH